MTKAYRRAIWVWTPREISHAHRTKELLGFCTKEKITDIYYQIIFREQEYPKVAVGIEGEEFFRDFLREAHEAALRVHALFGVSEENGKKGSARTLAQVKALIELNAASRPEERFDGIHYSFDLSQLKSPQTKNMRGLLLHFLQLLRRIRLLLRVKRSSLLLGVDIPCWLLRGSKGAFIRLLFDMRWKEVGEHILDTVDEAAVFTYRTEFSGDDGIGALVAPSIEYASKVKKNVFVGLEAIPLASDKASFAGMGKAALKSTEEILVEKFQASVGFGGIAVHDYENYRKLK
jgi:hypothetical protein